MLWNRVVKWWRVRWGGSVGPSLHFWWDVKVSLNVQLVEKEMLLLQSR